MSSPVVASPFQISYISTAQGKFGVAFFVGGYFFISGIGGTKATYFGLVNYWDPSPSIISLTKLGFGVAAPALIPNSTSLTAIQALCLLPANIAAWAANQLTLANINYQGIATTTIAAGSNGLSLPQSTINVVSTVGLSVGNAFSSVLIGGINQTVAFTGSTPNTLTGCTGGSGTLATGQTVTG